MKFKIQIISFLFISIFSSAQSDINFSSTLDLGVGKRAQEFSYNDNGLATVVKQAYLSYAPIRGLKIIAGKWATHFGYELLDATSKYINYDPNTKLGFTVRSEYFNDENNLVGVGTSIFQNTLSANLHFYKWTIIPEIRLDNSKNKIFINSNNNLNQYAGNFIIATVYKI